MPDSVFRIYKYYGFSLPNMDLNLAPMAISIRKYMIKDFLVLNFEIPFRLIFPRCIVEWIISHYLLWSG